MRVVGVVETHRLKLGTFFGARSGINFFALGKHAVSAMRILGPFNTGLELSSDGDLRWHSILIRGILIKFRDSQTVRCYNGFILVA